MNICAFASIQDGGTGSGNMMWICDDWSKDMQIGFGTFPRKLYELDIINQKYTGWTDQYRKINVMKIIVEMLHEQWVYIIYIER